MFRWCFTETDYLLDLRKWDDRCSGKFSCDLRRQSASTSGLRPNGRYSDVVLIFVPFLCSVWGFKGVQSPGRDRTSEDHHLYCWTMGMR